MTYDFRSTKVGVLLNTASGSCDENAEQELVALLAAAGVTPAKVWCGGGAEVAGALDDAKGHALDLMIVLGGDGTIRSAAEACVASGAALAPLPGGTMNMLPRALYGERVWQEALQATLSKPTLQSVSGGRIGDDMFFVAAIIGNPSLWAEAREAVREGELAEAIAKGGEALQKAFAHGLAYTAQGRSGSAEAISLLCPLISAALADDEQALELAIISTADPLAALRLGITSLFTNWRDDASVETLKARQVKVQADGPIPAILDGESVELPGSASVEFVETAFEALRPAG